ILYDTDLDNRTSNYYQNNQLFVQSIDGGAPKELKKDFDENLYISDWNEQGIFAIANQRTERHLFKLDPASGNVSLVADNPSQIFGVSFSNDGKNMAFRAENGDDLSEIYVTPTATFQPRKITNQSEEITTWKTAQSEVVNWKSKDGADIEGILHKPMDYDANRQYPLLVVIHGGPTGVDRADAVFSYVYPINQWLNKGALVLRVNYRGSAGYGAAFRALNVKNLGVGDAWDVLSGVDHLVSQGIVDENRMGCMGWSQGGYISAFLTTNTDKFKAISVGAGISNWMTYYVNTDIHPFTRQYLKNDPWNDEEVYRKTSPMTNILDAKTPTLIQHGEFDRRVPIPNAYELLQGLRDVGVDSRLVVYKGFGHGITKPKERLAAIWHNWLWFNKYVWGEETELPEGLDQR
ncbi:MAG: prolyl oligopeptidase family serine peptidase, partial [Bacteroidia bacterium]|nr:prolyl oligopeptidase family serine peptidase [Bacteroidia bacterium]